MRPALRGDEDVSSWSLIRPYAGQRRRGIALLGLLLLGATLLQVANPLVVRYYIDRATSGSGVRALMFAACAYLAVAAILQAVRVVASYVGENVAWGMTNALRTDLAKHCLELDYQFHKDHTPGELIERVDGDVTTLAKFLSSAFLVIIGNLLLVIGIFTALFLTSWQIGLVLAGYAAVALTGLLLIRSIAAPAWAEVRETSATMFGFLGERLSSVEDIRSNSAEGYVLGRLGGLNDRMLRAQRTARVRSAYIFVFMHGLYLLGYGGALAVGAVLYTRDLASLGTVYLIISYANFIYLPLNEVRTQIQDLQRAQAGMRRVLELFNTKRTVADGPGGSLPAGPLALEMAGVSLRYGPDEPWALRDVSLSLEPGQVLGLMGRTGSGKTTLARLVARMYDPTSGVVRLGGADLRGSRLDDIRGRIGMVTQDVQLFHGTVRDNLTLFDDGIDPDRIEHAIVQLGLIEWLRRLPDGIDTVLRSGQTWVSAGEAQLLGVCRVFLRDPGLVILDEASSRLDSESERLLERAIGAMLANRTGVVIAHRVSTVNRADRIVFLEAGRVVESGSRTDLLARPDSRLSRLIRDARGRVPE